MTTEPTFPLQTSQVRQQFRRRLRGWYRRHHRPLPWRESRDPYCVWISEIMLQQTQVATVEQYFRRFIQAFPNIAALAAAQEEEVLRLWEGLGYYRRARNLHATARQLAREHGGQFPRDVQQLQKLPGIGRYTAGAIASIAFSLPVPILEANTQRLLTRLMAYRGDPTTSQAQQQLWKLAKDLVSERGPGEFNQALMELGSLVCTPKEPKCLLCPVAACCQARASGLADQLPRQAPRPRVEAVHEVAVVVQHRGRLLLRKCGSDERWAGLWDFPRFARADHSGQSIAGSVQRLTGVAVKVHGHLATLRHGVTRFRITLHCYTAEYLSGRPRRTQHTPARWVPCKSLEEYPLSTTGRRLARLVSSPGGAE